MKIGESVDALVHTRLNYRM